MLSLTHLFENSSGKKLVYHGSHIQNLKILDPNKGITSSDLHDSKRIYAATTKKVASAFTFPWDDSMGVKFEYFDSSINYTLSVPKWLLKLLDSPCSIYTVSRKTFKKSEIGLPEEYFSKVSVKVLEEEKFNKVYDALKKYRVKLKII